MIQAVSDGVFLTVFSRDSCRVWKSACVRVFFEALTIISVWDDYAAFFGMASGAFAAMMLAAISS